MNISDINQIRLGAAVLEAEYGVWNRVAPAMVSTKAITDIPASSANTDYNLEFWLIQWKTCIDASADNMVYLMEKMKDTASKMEICQKRAEGEYSTQDLKEIEYRYTYISNTFQWEDYQKEKAFQEIKQLKSGIKKTVTDLKQDMREFPLLHKIPAGGMTGFRELMQTVKKKFYGIIDCINYEDFMSDDTDKLIENASGKLNEVLKELEVLSGYISGFYKEQTGKEIPVTYIKKKLSEWQELIRTESSDLKKPQPEFLAGGRKVPGTYGLSYEDGAYLMDKKI